MALRYFDIHSHLNFPDFDADRDEIIARMREEGIATITVGTDLESSRDAVALARVHPNLFATIGVHPTHDALFDEDVFAELARDTHVVAVGECGLDYYRGESQEAEIKEKQKTLFEKQIVFALAHDLPLMLHCRPSPKSMDAYLDALTILSSYSSRHASALRGNVHFFAGTTDIARRFLDIGFTMSFDGPVTFTHDYDDVIRFLPKEMIMAETDAPFAAPEPHRGGRNEPAYVVLITEHLAAVRGENSEVFREQCVQNAVRVFGLESHIKHI